MDFPFVLTASRVGMLYMNHFKYTEYTRNKPALPIFVSWSVRFANWFLLTFLSLKTIPVVNLVVFSATHFLMFRLRADYCYVNLWFEYVVSAVKFSAHSCVCVSAWEANIPWINLRTKHFMSCAVFITPLTLINKSLFLFPGSYEEEPIQWVFLFFFSPLSLWRFGSGELLPFWLLFFVFLGRDVSRQSPSCCSGDPSKANSSHEKINTPPFFLIRAAQRFLLKPWARLTA